MLPFERGELAWPVEGGAAFLHARAGAALSRHALPGLVCEQDFRPEAEALERAGLPLAAGHDGQRHPLVLVLPPRQREQARALYARALDRVAPGGRVLACAANNEGARSAEDDLRRLAGPLSTLSKNKARVFWTRPLRLAEAADRVDHTLLDAWRELDAPRPVAGGRFRSRPGVFAWDRIDPASALLAAHLPATLAGRAADLGAGFGYLAVELLERCPRITALDLYEADARALELARDNLAPFAGRAALGFHWHDVTAGLPERYEVIISNPPFHAQGRAERPDIGRAFIAAAAAALQPGGSLWLVANRHLPYEAALGSGFAQVETVAQQGGFKVVHARRSAR
ncbi:class I SAM-dependent methyltransferase [Lysobacter sp. GX 14042]|uniref:class I SAM-dependent methyltransferase n=1 Tax=Lysobacter sp. GX 14042 TaxID=2907155 RepID=UPI001F3EFC3F|nr:class I SAM-dependent methyltransferase [Lysobacter sp. GX 14042]MCE7033055.1 class I SAM-dependent methyltransferase [Lysobacter sp. GX 14042]